MFDPKWEEMFKSNAWGKYPSEDVIRFIARSFFKSPDRALVRILDLGCGAGANTWFLAREGFSAFGIDGSASAVDRASALLKKDGLTANFRVADFAVLDFPDAHFDAVVDANAIQHNVWRDIERIYAEVRRVLKPNGKFFSMMVADGTTGSESAERVEPNTFRNFQAGLITRGVLAHLFTRDEIKGLWRDYRDVNVNQLTRTDGAGEDQIAHFIVSGTKGV